MWNGVVTNVGKTLLSRWAQGGELTIINAKAGTGTVPVAQLMACTNISGDAHTLSLVKSTLVTGGVEYLVQFQATSSSYTAKQIGIWASLDSGAETLIAIYQTDGAGIEVPTYSEMPDFSIQFAATVQMDNTGALSVTIDTSAFVTLAAMNAALSGKKNIQTAVTDPTASGNGLSFIASITQDEQGVITPMKKTVQDGTTSQKGVVQLEDSHTSTSTDKAATPKAVKEAYDLADTANTAAGAAASAAAGKADPSTDLSLTATAAGWSNAEPPTQTISAAGVTATNNILVGAGSLTAEQRETMVAAQIACTAQGDGTITLTAYGEAPEVNLPIVVFILG